jgi:uncharacterized protein with von Willebrand factor type A (vWA) domain
MKVDLVQILAEMRGSLCTQFSKEFEQLDGLSTHLDEQLEAWRYTSSRQLLIDNPFYSFREQFNSWRTTPPRDVVDTKQMIQDFSDFNHFLKRPCTEDAKFFTKKLLSINQKRRTKLKYHQVALDLLLQRWQKVLDEEESAWHIDYMNELRSRIMTQLEDWLQQLKLLSAQLSTLGFEPGWWFDLSNGQLRHEGLEHIKRWVIYLQNDQGVQEIARLLGQFVQNSESEKIEMINTIETYRYVAIDEQANEEIVGLKIGADVANIVPAERSLLSDPDTAILFDLKFVENRLLCFESQGSFWQEEEQSVEKENSINENDSGPMILCVDTSGSMAGYPEQIAKAIALFLALKAKRENRACYIINFSTRIESFEVSLSGGLSNLFIFLKKSFHGGTDAAPALSHALEMMQKESYQKADLLMISDFVMGKLSSNILDKINLQRLQQNRFYSLVIGSHFIQNNMNSYFDREWIYDHRHQSINALSHTLSHISES